VLNDLEVSVNTVVRTTAYLNAVLFNVFFENWQGQKIIDSSERVLNSAYVLYNIKNGTFVKARVTLVYMKT
jgi:hypothetical protein